MRGWFDAFRVDGGPTLYVQSNRTPVVGDVSTLTIYVVFCTLFLAFLIVFPGIRKERFTTLLSVTVSLFIGAVILLTQHGTEWHVAEGRISSSYKAFSDEKIFADIGVRIGLNSVNITLRATSVHKENEEINFNERLYWMEASEIKKEFQKALVKGLPYPILTVAEYFSVDLEGFCWGRFYRQAGYFSHVLLWTAFASWVMMNIMMCVVPRYGAYTMLFTGLLMLITNAVYSLLLPKIPLMLKLEEGVTLTFKYGWCYWAVMAAGILAILFGTLIAVIELVYPHKFSTILLVDYDTPYSYFVSQKDINGDDNSHNRKVSKSGVDNKAFEHSDNPGGHDKVKRHNVVGWRHSLTDILGEGAVSRTSRSVASTKEQPQNKSSSSSILMSPLANRQSDNHPSNQHSTSSGNSYSIQDDSKGIRHPRLTRRPSGDVNIEVVNEAAMW